jgi:predicted subunit of tRNA(5-methylaminomethyl-2-thiouridylate) methyltransferase
MKAGVLYSGGKDSSLMAVILQRLGYQVELLTANFKVFPSWKPAAESAYHLGLKHRVLEADETLLQEAVDMILEDGFPNNGINYLHHKVLQIAAETYPVVADGTRRDDRVPKLHIDNIRSFEEKNGVEYLTLAGFGHKTVNNLSKNLFKVKKELTSMENNSDYEIEIRYRIREMEGEKGASRIFPEHLQSRVIGWVDP